MDRARNLLEQIKGRLEELNKAERKVAEAILLSPQQATRFSIAALALAAIYNMAQPSYAPKGTVQRSQVPAFTESSASVEDRNSKPVPGDVRDQRMRDAVHNGLDFKP